jgi:molybdopterin molybdotransferase
VLSPQDAETLVARHVQLAATERVPLARATGAILREPVFADRDQPAFDRVTMDGIAVASASAQTTWLLRGLQAAGAPPLTLAAPAHAIEVMTGAVLPHGCDAVIPVERLELAEGRALSRDRGTVAAWSNVHRRGSDITRGALLLDAGMQLSAAEIAIAAGAGLAQLTVSRQPRIAVISTGDELIEPGQAILPHQVWRSNVYGVLASLRRAGFDQLRDEHLPDDRARLQQRLGEQLEQCDVLILSGGVSMGKLDFVPQVLADLGVHRVFHKVAQRPGKPFWFGHKGRSLVFALPGNPVSTFVCMARYVLPALAAGLGHVPVTSARLALSEAVPSLEQLALFMPVRTTIDEESRAWATPQPTNGSGDFSALRGTQGFVELPAGRELHPRGFVARLYRW